MSGAKSGISGGAAGPDCASLHPGYSGLAAAVENLRVCAGMRRIVLAIVLLAGALGFAHPAQAVYRITRDFGGLVDEYKARFTSLRDRGERIVIDGVCNSACTLVLGIVPRNRICVTPRASLGFHTAYIDKRWTGGLHVTSLSGTADLVSYYPSEVKAWINRQGGLTRTMKRMTNGADLWAVIDPCPEEY